MLFVIVLVGCILYSPLSFGILFTIIAALSVHEFAHLVNKSGEVSINRMITALGGAYLFLALMGFCTSAIDARVFLPYLGLLLYLMITELYLKRKSHWQLGILHAKPVICGLAFRIAERTCFPELTGNEQRNLQSHPAPFYLRVHLVERHRRLLRRVFNRQASSLRAYLS